LLISTEMRTASAGSLGAAAAGFERLLEDC
jgi:hypothetical protein